jgi:hypothetical protein
VLGYLLAEVQILVLGLDKQNANTEGAILTKDFWYFVTMTAMCYLILVLPAGLFYTSNDDITNHVSQPAANQLCAESPRKSND